jgi:hypothetical protein
VAAKGGAQQHVLSFSCVAVSLALPTIPPIRCPQVAVCHPPSKTPPPITLLPPSTPKAVSKTSRGGQHVVVRLQLAEPSTGSVEPLLALKDAASQPAGASHLLAAAADSRSDSEHEDGGGGRGGSVDPGEERGAVVGGKRGICSKGLGPKVQHRGPALDADDADGDGGSDSGSGGGRHSRPHRRADPRCVVHY